MTTRNLGPYRLIGDSTRGKTGIVHVAVDTNLDQQVELTELPGLGATDPAIWSAFQGVMERLASVESESIATPTDFARTSDHGAWYVTAPRVGTSLGEMRERLGRLHWRQACMILYEIATAVSFAHSRGVAHGNLNPSALVFEVSGAAQIRSFAVLARVHLEKPGQVEVGLAGLYDQPSYLSPEALSRRPPNLASDVFALGVMAYELLVGEHPFGSMTGVLAYAESEGEPPDPGAAGVTIPMAIRELVMDMLRIRVDQRVKEAGTIAQKLRAQLNDVGVTKIRASLGLEFERQRGLFKPGRLRSRSVRPVDSQSATSLTTGVSADSQSDASLGTRVSPEGTMSPEAELLVAQMMAVSVHRKGRSPFTQGSWALIFVLLLIVFGGGLYLYSGTRQARRASQAAMGMDPASQATRVTEPVEEIARVMPPAEDLAVPPDWDAGAVLLFKAQVALDRGENERAERLARSGLDILGPRDPSLQWILAQALERQNQTDLAVGAYLASDAAERGQTKGRVAAGFLLGAANRCDEAIVHYQTAVKGGDGSARLYTLLGSCQLLLGALEDAVESLQRARTLGSDELDVLMPLASALDLLGQLDLAREAYTRVLKLRPQHGRAKAALDRIDVLRANPERAREWLAERANAPLQVDPHALGVEAYAAFTAGQYGRAADLYQKLIDLSSGKATHEQLKNLAIALDRSKPGQSSVEAIERALETSGKDPSLSLLLGKRLMSLGRAQDAMKHLKVAATSEKLQWSARFDLGLARMASGDPRGAVTEFGSLVAQRPEDRGAIQNLAKAQVEAGMNEGALTTLERLERLAPREAEHWLARAAILQKMDRHGAAAKLLKRACADGVGAACQ